MAMIVPARKTIRAGMVVYLNGQFVPEEEARISIHDRGFLYGDGLLETIRVYGQQPFLWEDHMARLTAGCETLQIASPLATAELKEVVAELLRQNQLSEAIIRIHLSRGVGPRGYSFKGANRPTLVISAFPHPQTMPASYRLITSSIRLSDQDPFAHFKHSNKLRQIAARAEADAVGANEALMLNDSGEVVEGTTTNLFWIEGQTVCTPPLNGILPGTTRKYVLRLSNALDLPTKETRITMPSLLKADGIFVTSCGIEVMEATELDGIRLNRSAIVTRLRESYQKVTVR